MANNASARKRARQAEKRRRQNASQRSMARTSIKRVRAAIQSGNKEAAASAFTSAVPVIDRMVNHGMLHKNTAARHKSRLNALIKAM